MKNKLKLWILQIEGWKKGHLNLFHKISSRCVYDNFDIEQAWNKTFPNFYSIVRTNIFWLIFPMVSGALFLLFSDNSTIISGGIHWFNYAGLICFIWPLIFTFISIATWIIKLIKGENK